MTVLQMFHRDRLLLVFRYPQYRWFFSGYAISWIGNNMQVLANSWLALLLTGSPSVVAYVFIASTLPGVVFSPFIGVLVDRFDRRWIIVVVDTLRALLLFLLFLIGIRGQLQVWQLYATAGLLSLGEIVYTPSAIALLREEIPREVLVYTNSYNGIARQLGGVIGASIGGALIALFSPYLVFLVNSCSFLCSVISMLNIRRGYRSPAQPSTQGNRLRRFVQDMTDGWNYIRGRGDIIVLYSILVITLSTLDIINVALPIFVKNVLHTSVAVMGGMEAAFSIGSIAGNILITAIAAAKGAYRTMTLGICAVVLALLILAFSFNAPLAILSYLLLGGTLPVWLLYQTSVQKIVPDNFQGRVNATFRTFSLLISLIVFFGISYVVGVISVRILYIMQAALLLIPCILAYKYIFPQKEEQQAPIEAQKASS